MIYEFPVLSLIKSLQRDWDYYWIYISNSSTCIHVNKGTYGGILLDKGKCSGIHVIQGMCCGVYVNKGTHGGIHVNKGTCGGNHANKLNGFNPV